MESLQSPNHLPTVHKTLADPRSQEPFHSIFWPERKRKIKTLPGEARLNVNGLSPNERGPYPEAVEAREDWLKPV